MLSWYHTWIYLNILHQLWWLESSEFRVECGPSPGLIRPGEVNLTPSWGGDFGGLDVDERNAQQFVEQLGPGKRPLWAVPVILRHHTPWGFVFQQIQTPSHGVGDVNSCWVKTACEAKDCGSCFGSLAKRHGWRAVSFLSQLGRGF